MNIACVIILYHPDEKVLINIGSYASAFKKIFVFDNSETSEDPVIKKIIDLPNIVYLHDGRNRGIASRLNDVCQLALLEGYEWILTMDQDSSFGNGMINEYFKCIESFQKRDRVAMFGVNHEAKVTEQNDCTSQETDMLITSGSVVNLALFQQVGKFDEKLFIDYVDVDYCLRSKLAGYKIMQFKNIYLTHYIGEVSYHHSLKNFRSTPRSLHPPIRFYYMSRNFFYVFRKYNSDFPDVMKRSRQGLLNNIKNNVLYNKKRITVLMYLIKGFYAYRKKQMGKMND